MPAPNGARVAALGVLIVVGYMFARAEVYKRLPVTRAVALAPDELDRRTDEELFRTTGVHWREGALDFSGMAMDYEQAKSLQSDVRFIQERLQNPQDWDLWFRRDLVMGLPRLAGLALCLLVAGLYGGWRRWGWHGGAPAGPCVLLAVLFVGYLLQFLGRAKVASFTPGQIGLGWLATVPVALFEEAAFRGLIFLGLTERLSPRKAALASSFLFMVWHFQAQSIGSWPSIFLYGMASCGALYAGVGLPVQAVVHEVVDSVWYFIGTDGSLPYAYPLLARGGFFVMAAAAVWGWRLLGTGGNPRAPELS